MTRILHVILTVDPRYGGPIEGVMRSAEVLDRFGHVRHIVSLDPPTEEWVRAAPVKVFALGPSSNLYRTLKRFFPLLRYGYTPNLRRWLKANANKYDAIVINGMWNYASLGTWSAVRHLNVPYFVFPHGMLDPWSVKQFPIKGLAKQIFWILFERLVLRDAAGTMYTCASEMHLAKLKFFPYSARDYVVGYGTKDIPPADPKQLEAFFTLVPKARGRKLILFLSRIHEKKGVDLLLYAFSRICGDYPNLDLVIAGPDQNGLKASLTDLTRKLTIENRVHWPGMLTGHAKWGAFRASEFFVLPSHQENFGIAIVEALAAELPVLITDKVNIWQEIEWARAGIVITDTLDAIEEGLRSMCALGVQERSEVCKNARDLFLNKFNLDEIALKHLAMYESLKR